MDKLKNDIKNNEGIFSIAILFISIIIINFRWFIFNPEPSVTNFIMSIGYLAAWIYFMNKARYDFIFCAGSTIFWLVTSFAAVIYYFIYILNFTGEVFAPLGFIFISPIFAIGELLAPYSNGKVYITILIAVIMFLLNYKNFRPLEIERFELEEE